MQLSGHTTPEFYRQQGSKHTSGGDLIAGEMKKKRFVSAIKLIPDESRNVRILFSLDVKELTNISVNETANHLLII